MKKMILLERENPLAKNSIESQREDGKNGIDAKIWNKKQWKNW